MTALTQYHCLKEKNVFITGGATGIGAAIVQAFIGQGANVAFVDIAESEAKALMESIDCTSTRNSLWYRSVDVSESKTLQTAINDAASHFGGLDILVNCAGDDTRSTTSELLVEEWNSSLNINLTSAFMAAQSAYHIMKRQQRGSIINFGTINALIGMENMAGYITAKAGLMGMTKALAKDFGNDNIRVNTILPGWVATQKQLDSWLTEEQEQKWMEQVALKKRIKPEDVADLALFLASNHSALITGQCIAVDGGRT